MSNLDFLFTNSLKVSDSKPFFEPVTLQNFDSSLTKINQQLSDLSLPCPLVLEANYNNILVLESFIAMILQKRVNLILF
jgi:hypothetical protein